MSKLTTQYHTNISQRLLGSDKLNKVFLKFSYAVIQKKIYLNLLAIPFSGKFQTKNTKNDQTLIYGRLTIPNPTHMQEKISYGYGPWSTKCSQAMAEPAKPVVLHIWIEAGH